MAHEWAVARTVELNATFSPQVADLAVAMSAAIRTYEKVSAAAESDPANLGGSTTGSNSSPAARTTGAAVLC